jgi:hypothetical protein
MDIALLLTSQESEPSSVRPSPASGTRYWSAGLLALASVVIGAPLEPCNAPGPTADVCNGIKGIWELTRAEFGTAALVAAAIGYVCTGGLVQKYWPASS